MHRSQRHQDQIMADNDHDRQIRDDCILDFNLLIMNTSLAGVTLSEVTAQAVKDGAVNGGLKTAMDNAKKVKADYLDFITRQGIKNIINIKGDSGNE
jgi:hypothetical protein